MKIKKDKYLKNRGGTYKIYDLLCERCGKKLFTYQKDGPGPLRRLYLDRIREGEVGQNKLMKCSCGKMIGYQYVYEKENRPALKLFAGSIAKKINKDK